MLGRIPFCFDHDVSNPLFFFGVMWQRNEERNYKHLNLIPLVAEVTW